MTILADRAAPLTDPAAQKSPILSVRDLRVEFATGGSVVRAVDGVSWTAHAGEIMALVGESGCGKSATAAALTRLLPGRAGRIAGGSAMFDGKDLLGIPDREMRAIRGRDIGMVFQEPMTALNPALRIGPQIEEPLRIHGMATQARARERALELMRLVGISDPERRYDQYPHHLSGGMRQRVLIAMALICDPRLIIADEPTTALDVTIQAQILDLMRDLVQRLGIALVLITHNLGIVARYADRLNVMYAGKIVESGPVDAVFANPGHPYSRGLIRSVPRLDIGREERLATIEGLPPDLSNPPAGCRFAPRCAHRTEACAVEPLLSRFGPDSMAACWHAGIAASPAPSRPAELRTTAKGAGALVLDNVAKHFVMGKGQVVRAVDGVGFEVGAGRTLGLVGESGCGKTTVGRMILGFAKPTDGVIALDGNTIAGDNAVRHPRLWKSLQVVFQDPFSSLNPRMTVGGIIAEPIRVHGLRRTKHEIDERIGELLSLVSLPASVAKRYPHQLSGGQRQRIGIARALAHEPEFLVLDEPVSALDVSVQGQIVNLLSDLQEKLGLGYLFIAHDLAVVRHLSHDVAVMYLGRIVEIGTREQIYQTPQHPYTRALLDAVPIPDPETERMRRSQTLGGEIPSPLAPPPGCAFHTRCPLATAECRETVPALRRLEDGRAAACIKL